jgi:hypothetical protein
MGSIEVVFSVFLSTFKFIFVLDLFIYYVHFPIAIASAFAVYHQNKTSGTRLLLIDVDCCVICFYSNISQIILCQFVYICEFICSLVLMVTH